MQKKTISKVIKSKMNAWLETLPKELAEEVKPNIVVSGGSIASMFLKEDVNDYDVYLKDIDVLKKLCTHYGKLHNIDVLDGRDRDNILLTKYDFKDGDELPSFKDGSEYSSELFIRWQSMKKDQIKMNTGSGVRINQMKNLDETGVTKPFSVSFISPNAISLTDDLQIVCRFSGSVEEIHKTFDFIHATNYFTFEEGVVTNLAAMESLLTKQLKYQGSLYPVTSIIRSKKFIKRNWNIGAGEYLKIMFQISELNLSDPVILEDQLIGVDVAYFGMLIDTLKVTYSKDPNFKMTSSFLNDLIEKIFNEDSE
jgi:hypothetical protein